MANSSSQSSALSNKTLALCFTQGVSLRAWSDTGLFDREVDLYNRLCHHLKGVNFLTYGDRTDKAYYEQLNDGIQIYPNRNKILRKASRRWQRVLYIQHRKVLRDSDIIKTNQIAAAPLALFAKSAFGKKVITRCGYLWSYMAEKENRSADHIRNVYNLERRAFQEADVGVVTTAEIRDMIIERHQVNGEKLRVIPNFVNTDIFKPLPEIKKEPGLICFVGKFEHQKNLLALLDAVSITNRSKLPDPVRLCLIGEGSLEAELKRRVTELNLIAEFHPRLPNYQLPKILNRAEAFVLVSNFEGHPKTSLEAMACELPLIGTNVTGIREEVTHEKTGYLCDTSPESIAQGIQHVMSNPALREQMGKAARKHVIAEYSLDRIVEMELEVLESVLQT
jgi:glycosyltransferase involved in cell wall biosynthesis